MKKVLVALAVLVLAGAAVFFLVFNGNILLNNPSLAEYPVRGVDVSAYQGDIHWPTLADEGISFAFIKATEGSSFVDKKFEYNLENALATDLRVGAYHFFSYDSPGLSQAENFIAAVPDIPGMLPQVVDVEFYGDKEKNPPEAAYVHAELSAMLDSLETHYGSKPIIYATEKSYEMFIAHAFEEYNIWIRDVIFQPEFSDGRDWTFWQYTNRARLDGYQGEEKFIDMNVFCGSASEFSEYHGQ